MNKKIMISIIAAGIWGVFMWEEVGEFIPGMTLVSADVLPCTYIFGCIVYTTLTIGGLGYNKWFGEKKGEIEREQLEEWAELKTEVRSHNIWGEGEDGE